MEVETRLQNLHHLCQDANCSPLASAIESSMHRTGELRHTLTRADRVKRSIQEAQTGVKSDLVEALIDGIAEVGRSQVGVDATALKLWLAIWERGPIRYRAQAATTIKKYLVALAAREQGDVRDVLAGEEALAARLCSTATSALKPQTLGGESTADDAAVIMDIMVNGEATRKEPLCQSDGKRVSDFPPSLSLQLIPCANTNPGNHHRSYCGVSAIS